MGSCGQGVRRKNRVRCLVDWNVLGFENGGDGQAKQGAREGNLSLLLTFS
jgi:hypothetical protein